jgi:hypothetical protein
MAAQLTYDKLAAAWGVSREAARKKVEGLHLPVRVDWNRPLTRVLVLKTGERLRTLHDAADLFTRRFGSVTKSAPLGHAIRLLLGAAETGTRADRKAATDQVALVLRLNVMI